MRGKKEKSSGAREKGERRRDSWGSLETGRDIYQSMLFTVIHTLQLRTGTIVSLRIKR